MKNLFDKCFSLCLCTLLFCMFIFNKTCLDIVLLLPEGVHGLVCVCVCVCVIFAQNNCCESLSSLNLFITVILQRNTAADIP